MFSLMLINIIIVNTDEEMEVNNSTAISIVYGNTSFVKWLDNQLY